jgi:hypothetical protein
MSRSPAAPCVVVRLHALHQLRASAHFPPPPTPASQVDDDVIFIAPNAIELLVREKLERDRFLFVSANVVAHTTLSHVHGRLGGRAAPAAGGPIAASPGCTRVLLGAASRH